MTDLSMMTTTRRRLRAAHEGARVAADATRFRAELLTPLLTDNATLRAAARGVRERAWEVVERYRDALERAHDDRLRLQDALDKRDTRPALRWQFPWRLAAAALTCLLVCRLCADLPSALQWTRSNLQGSSNLQ